jgi:hypothetical protein
MKSKIEQGVLFFGANLGGKYPEWNKVLHERKIKIILVEEPGDRTQRLNDLVKQNPNHPNSFISDKILGNSSDLKSLVKEVLKICKKYQIVGVINNRENFSIAAAFISQLLNLPSPGLFAATVSRDKSLQRAILPEYSPSHETASCKDLQDSTERLKFPLVIKPINRSGSSGVSKIHCKASLKNHLRDFESFETLLCEELVEGPEFSVESFVKDRKVILSGVTEKITNETDSDYFVELGHRYPATNISLLAKEKLQTVQEKILKKLDFRTGIAHGEYRISESGKIFLMEIAVRPPGDGILELYCKGHNFNFFEFIIDLVLGNNPSPPTALSRWASQTYIPVKNGTFKGIISKSQKVKRVLWHRNGDINCHPLEDNDAIFLEVSKEASFTSTKSSLDRLGSFIITNSDPNALIDEEREVYDHLEVQFE